MTMMMMVVVVVVTIMIITAIITVIKDIFGAPSRMRSRRLQKALSTEVGRHTKYSTSIQLLKVIQH